jgi:putative phosphoesterase
MKYLIASDLHGSSSSAQFLIERFNELKCDKLILLGDILYHGPRNDLPLNYNPKEVIALLNPLAYNIIAINGNCDAEVDQMVLKFKLNKSLDLILNGIEFHLEHGHHLDEYDNTKYAILYGHTHIKRIEKVNDNIFLNPGSITIPKDGILGSYMVLDNNELSLFDTENNLLNSILL